MNEIEETAKLITALSLDAFDTAQIHGFWQEIENSLIIPTQLALIVSEVAEALEIGRDNSIWDEQRFTEELADIVIRVLNLAGALNLNIGKAIISKMIENRERPYHHGNKKY